MKATVEGLHGIKATVLAYSISEAGKKIITWEIEYPRLILAELNTHRQLSRNSYSSRAVPFIKMLEQLHAEPVRFGQNKAGMQDQGVDYDADVLMDVDFYDQRGLQRKKLPFKPRQAWRVAKTIIIELARAFSDAGYHKQVYNRLLEPFQMQKTVLSATEVDNFFWLRNDDAADPTIRELARVMRAAMDASVPEVLQPGEWHLPYIWIDEVIPGERTLHLEQSGQTLTLDEAIKVSCARCAAVSYRNEGYGLEKSLEIYDRLVGDSRKHASAFEHCATPMQEKWCDDNADQDSINWPTLPHTWEPGISHMDRDKKLWSGNFQGWIQFRKLIPGECYVSE